MQYYARYAASLSIKVFKFRTLTIYYNFRGLLGLPYGSRALGECLVRLWDDPPLFIYIYICN